MPNASFTRYPRHWTLRSEAINVVCSSHYEKEEVLHISRALREVVIQCVVV